MNTREQNSPSRDTKSILFKLAAFSVPVGVILASAFFQLTPIVRQGLIGLILIWMMVGAFVNYSFMG